MKKQSQTATHTLFSFLFFSLFFTGSAAAKDVSQLDMLRCTSIASVNKKLECFESLIEVMPMVSAETAAVENDEEEEDVTATKKRSWSDRFGLSALKKKAMKVEAEDNKETYRATVTKVEEGNYRILYFFTDEGHVWRQLEATRFWYPKKESFEIVVNQGRMGEYQLKIGDKGKFTSVRRLK